MNTMKKRIRLIVLIAVVAVMAVAAILHFSLEPADYRVEIHKQTAAALTLLEEAVTGNDEGQYSEDAVLALQTSLDRANELADSALSTTDDLRNCYAQIKKDIKTFKGQENRLCVSANQLEALQEENVDFTQTIKIDGIGEIVWRLPCKEMGQAAPVNLQIETEGFYGDQVRSLMEVNGLQGTMLHFLHNGALPVRADITLYQQMGTAHLYRYDAVRNALIYVCPAKTAGEEVTFSIAMGGYWIVSPANPEDLVKGTTSSAPTEDQTTRPSEINGTEPGTPPTSTPTSPMGPGADATSTTSQPNSTTTESKEIILTQPSSSITTPAHKSYVTVSIRCDTILDNLDDLKQGLEDFVPADGVILAPIKVEILEGETAFDVLKRVTRNEKIQMEFRNDPLYSGAYVEGIGHLYEFDCGSGSGWMYKVNGWFPNYGCSQYQLKDGDTMEWCYTCDVGKDVGDQYWD